MNGHVLSDAQFEEIVRRQEKWDEEPFGVYPDENNPAFVAERLEMSWLASQVPHLIATIKNRNTEIYRKAWEFSMCSQGQNELREEIARQDKQIEFLNKTLQSALSVLERETITYHESVMLASSIIRDTLKDSQGGAYEDR